MKIKSFELFQEKKERLKIPSKETNKELDKSNLKNSKKLNLAKTTKGLKESHDETQNYMFFNNLEHICRMVTEIDEMSQEQVDSMLSDHDWASDHMSRSFESISHVYHWLKATMNGEEYSVPDSILHTENLDFYKKK